MKIRLMSRLAPMCFTALLLVTCRQDPSLSPVPANVDFRDTVLGSYHGMMHKVVLVTATSAVTSDTTYPDTLVVTPSSVESRGISLGRFYALLNSSYILESDPWWASYHGAVSGRFLLNPAYDSLYLHNAESWAALTTVYDFSGVK